MDNSNSINCSQLMKIRKYFIFSYHELKESKFDNEQNFNTLIL